MPITDIKSFIQNNIMYWVKSSNFVTLFFKTELKLLLGLRRFFNGNTKKYHLRFIYYYFLK